MVASGLASQDVLIWHKSHQNSGFGRTRVLPINHHRCVVCGTAHQARCCAKL